MRLSRQANGVRNRDLGIVKALVLDPFLVDLVRAHLCRRINRAGAARSVRIVSA
jgi:hypothetical protein